ncbi:MAG TPA: YidB family protein, partial [Steroidobacteraceae bacterium]
QASGGQATPGMPAGLSGGAIAALLPVLMAMLSQGGGSQQGGGLGGMLSQVLGGGAGGGGAPDGLGGGLGGLLKQIEQAGFGDHARSWVGTGQNQPISPDAIGQIFGQDGLADIARRAGLSPQQASAGLADLLPAVVDHVTPGGQVPSGSQVENVLGGLLKQFGG